MALNLNEPYKFWIINKIGANVDETTKFNIKLAAKTEAGSTDVEVSLDITWFALIYVDETPEMKLQVALAMLQQPDVLARFKATIDDPAVKRIIEEFLIFNSAILDGLKSYIDFTKLNIPIDFISHILFIKRADGEDTKEISAERLKSVVAVLDTGFALLAAAPSSTDGAVVRKVLLMQFVTDNFQVAKRLLDAHYTLFGNIIVNNTEVSTLIIDNRNNPFCQSIIQDNILLFKNIAVNIPGGNDHNNLADFYYWVREDMEAVRFVKKVLGIELSATT